MLLDSKRVLITGGAGDIGSAIAQRFGAPARASCLPM